VRAAPEDPEARRWRGHCRTALGRYDDALRDLDIALKHAPGHAWTWYARGMARHHLGQPQAAIDDYTQALKLDPTHAKAVEWRGFNHARLGDHLAAWLDFTRAVELDPRNGWVYRSRARAALALGADARAERDLECALELDGKDAEAHAQLGFALAARGAGEKALVHFDRAIALDPNNHEYARLWRYWLGQRLGRALDDPLRGLPERGWPGDLARVLGGGLTRTGLLQRVAGYGFDEQEFRTRTCEAHFYLGLRALLEDRPSTAQGYLREALVRGNATMPEWRWARYLARQ
jgi:tetratricopeptide (TPR) repeat protein